MRYLWVAIKRIRKFCKWKKKIKNRELEKLKKASVLMLSSCRKRKTNKYLAEYIQPWKREKKIIFLNKENSLGKASRESNKGRKKKKLKKMEYKDQINFPHTIWTFELLRTI